MIGRIYGLAHYGSTEYMGRVIYLAITDTRAVIPLYFIFLGVFILISFCVSVSSPACVNISLRVYVYFPVCVYSCPCVCVFIFPCACLYIYLGNIKYRS